MKKPPAPTVFLRFLTNFSGACLLLVLSACGKKDEVAPGTGAGTGTGPTAAGGTSASGSGNVSVAAASGGPASSAAMPSAGASAANALPDKSGAAVPAPAPTSVPAAGGTPAEAMARFKAEVEVIKDFVEANQAAADPAAGLASLRELIKRAEAVRTDGLPEDLATAYKTMTGVMQRVQSALDDMPVPMDQLQSHLENQKQISDAAGRELQAKIEAFKTTMEGLGKESEAASAKLKEVGAKYGIQALELGPQ